MRFRRTLATVLLSITLAVAADESSKSFIMNFDFDLSEVDAAKVIGSLQLQGIRLQADKPFHGKDLGEFDYFFTVSEIEDGKGKLTIEFYRYESRRKKSAVSEIVSEVEFAFGSPAQFQTKNENIALDLAFSIDRR